MLMLVTLTMIDGAHEEALAAGVEPPFDSYHQKLDIGRCLI